MSKKLTREDYGGVFGRNPVTVRDLISKLEKFDKDLIIISGINTYNETITTLKEIDVQDIVLDNGTLMSGSVVLIS